MRRPSRAPPTPPAGPGSASAGAAAPAPTPVKFPPAPGAHPPLMGGEAYRARASPHRGGSPPSAHHHHRHDDGGRHYDDGGWQLATAPVNAREKSPVRPPGWGAAKARPPLCTMGRMAMRQKAVDAPGGVQRRGTRGG
eukprot:gene14020-6617_t